MSRTKRGNAAAALAVLGVVAVVGVGCVSGRYGGRGRGRGACDALSGVFHNVGRNNEDAAEVDPKGLEERLLDRLVDPDDAPRDLADVEGVSVAIRHTGRGKLRFAVLDQEGNVLTTGSVRRYERCSRGVLERVWKEDMGSTEGWLGSDERRRATLFVSAEGTLVLATESKAIGLFLGFPVVGGFANWAEFQPDRRFDVRAIDF